MKKGAGKEWTTALINELASHRFDFYPLAGLLHEIADRTWQEAFARGYERGKKDEQDAKEIDQYLEDNDENL